MAAARFYPLTIAALRPETDAALCVTLAVPEHLRAVFAFKQGQFLTLRAQIAGEDVRRSYSICSGVHEGVLQVGIKRVSGGIFSNFANDQFSVGDTLDVMPPQGSFYTETLVDSTRNYLCIAVGSGITPMLSMIKTVLQAEPNSTLTLLYGNRRSNSVMFRETLGFIKNRYLSRFNWINIMSGEDQGAEVLNGRIDRAKIMALQQARLINLQQEDEVFICGPQAMMTAVSEGLQGLGLDAARIHYELFAPATREASTRRAKTRQRIAHFGADKTCQVSVIADGRTLTFALATAGESLLEAGLQHGMALPYSCKAGVCSTCKAKLLSGAVDRDTNYGLAAHEVAAGYILTCQAHPIADVVVDFDQR